VIYQLFLNGAWGCESNVGILTLAAGKSVTSISAYYLTDDGNVTGITSNKLYQL
jgi:hypothetical protein